MCFLQIIIASIETRVRSAYAGNFVAVTSLRLREFIDIRVKQYPSRLSACYENILRLGRYTVLGAHLFDR